LTSKRLERFFHIPGCSGTAMAAAISAAAPAASIGTQFLHLQTSPGAGNGTGVAILRRAPTTACGWLRKKQSDQDQSTD
jgi:hypothetical protein